MVAVYVVAAIFGLMVGSFLNVCIYRIPLPDVSIFRPRRSFCPRCEKLVAAYDNLPVLSFLLLGGKCRHCKTSIGLEYPIVEILTGLAAFWSVWQYGLTISALALFFYVCLLITLSAIDLHHYLIPNKIILCGIGILPLFAIAEIFATNRPPLTLVYGVIGLLMGGIFLLLIALLGELVFRKEAMGGGDIKLMAMMGMFLAWWPSSQTGFLQEALFLARQFLLILILGAFAGAAAGIGVIVARSKGAEERIIPFGPFLAAGSLVAIYFGDPIWHWYLGFLR